MRFDPYQPNKVPITRYSPTSLKIRHLTRTCEFFAYLPYISPVTLAGLPASFTGQPVAKPLSM